MKAILDKILDIILSPLAVKIDSFDLFFEGVFSRITDNIYLGRRPDENTVPELKQARITHVVSCLDEKQVSSVEFFKKDFDHLFLGVHDGMHEDIAATFPEFFKFAENVAIPPSTTRLFVHCESGVSRSAALVIALRMKLEFNYFFDVFKAVKSKRAQVLPNIGFASQLQQFENHLLRARHTKTPSSLALYLHQVCNFPADIDILQSALEQHGFDAVEATRAIFGGEIPRVIQGVKQ